jgi:hypothetical protein
MPGQESEEEQGVVAPAIPERLRPTLNTVLFPESDDGSAFTSMETSLLAALSSDASFVEGVDTPSLGEVRALSPSEMDISTEEAARNALEDRSQLGAHELYQRLTSPDRSYWEGGCLLSTLQPSGKSSTGRSKYIQVSYQGANKIMTLQEFLLIYDGRSLDEAKGRGALATPPVVMQASHRCNRPACLIPHHIIVESIDDNDKRKNCIVWFRCPHGCRKWILVCPHNPPCVKEIPGIPLVPSKDFPALNYDEDYVAVHRHPDGDCCR